MTFSANPARTSLRDRLARGPARQRATNLLLLTALGLVCCGALLVLVLARDITEEQATRFGNALAAESAQRAAEYIVHDDLVSLNVVTGSLTRLPGILGVTVYDRNRQPLAQSGQVQPTADTITVRSLVLTEGREERGSVELIIDPAATSPAMSRLYSVLVGWLGFSIALLLIVARLVRDLPVATGMTNLIEKTSTTPSQAHSNVEKPIVERKPVPEALEVNEGAILRINVVNQEALEKRLASYVLAEALDAYDLLLLKACKLHQGEVIRHIGDECQVFFADDPSQEGRASFRATCCARLFLEIARETAVERKDAGGIALQFTSAVHEDPLLDIDDLAMVTGEICRQAGVAGRVVITEVISDHPLIGPRLMADRTHPQLLHVIVEGQTDQARQQDLNTFTLTRLSSPYEELLSQQVQRFLKPSATT